MMTSSSHTRSNTGRYVKYVLEQPPVLFTIVNILSNNHCKKEAGALKLVLKSNVTNDVIDKVFKQTRYAFHFNNAVKERIMRYKNTVDHWLDLWIRGTSARYNIKIIYNLFQYIVNNKELLYGHGLERFKYVLFMKLDELILEPSITKMMIKFHTLLS